MTIVFTGLAYLYMCLCFYLLFAGLILLHTILHDLWKVEEGSKMRLEEYRRAAGEIGLRVMRGIFRCTVLGVLVAICMKAQSAYLASNGEDILTWLANDMSLPPPLINGIKHTPIHWKRPANNTQIRKTAQYVYEEASTLRAQASSLSIFSLCPVSLRRPSSFQKTSSSVSLERAEKR